MATVYRLPEGGAAPKGPLSGGARVPVAEEAYALGPGPQACYLNSWPCPPGKHPSKCLQKPASCALACTWSMTQKPQYLSIVGICLSLFSIKYAQLDMPWSPSQARASKVEPLHSEHGDLEAVQRGQPKLQLRRNSDGMPCCEDDALACGAQGDFDSGVLRLMFASLATPPTTIDYNMATGKQCVALV